MAPPEQTAHSDDSIAPATIAAGARPLPALLPSQEALRGLRQDSLPWTVDRPRYQLSGRTWGSGSPLYFLNGMGGTHELFAQMAWYLRDRFRCVLVEYPGTSIASGRRLTLGQIAEDVFAIADQAGDATFDLFATSFGGLVATECMLQHPARIRRAVLQGTFAQRPLSAAERALIRVCRHLPGRVRHIPFAQQVMLRLFRVTIPADDFIRTLAQRAGLLRDADYRQSLASVEQPVLVVTGDQDRLVPAAYGQELANALPHGRMHCLPGAGHLPFLTHSRALSKLVREFLAESESPL